MLVKTLTFAACTGFRSRTTDSSLKVKEESVPYAPGVPNEFDFPLITTIGPGEFVASCVTDATSGSDTLGILPRLST